MDAIRASNEITVLEINPRFTASMELFDSDEFSVIENHIRGCLGEGLLSDVDVTAKSFAGKCILYAKKQTKFPADISQLAVRDIRLADIPQPQRIEQGYPILTLTGHASTRQGLLQALKSGSNSVYDNLAKED